MGKFFKDAKLSRAKAIVRYAESNPKLFPKFMDIPAYVRKHQPEKAAKIVKKYPEFSSNKTPAWLRKVG